MEGFGFGGDWFGKKIIGGFTRFEAKVSSDFHNNFAECRPKLRVTDEAKSKLRARWSDLFEHFSRAADKRDR